MARFRPPEAYRSQSASMQLLPLRFERISPDRNLVSNIVGDFIWLSDDEHNRVVNLEVSPDDGLYEKAFRAHLLSYEGRDGQKQLLAARMRSRMAFLRTPTPLHIFVVTLRCEHSCPYCQVSRQSTDRSRFDMSEEVAQRALDIAFESPSPRLKIEFQGGEPLLNFELI